MYVVVIIRYRRPLEEIQARTDEHRAYLRGLQAEGKLIASGPFDPRSGGALLLRVPDEGLDAALDAIRDGDPFVKHRLGQWEILKWAPVIGREALDKL